jgi:transposase-like protein
MAVQKKKQPAPKNPIFKWTPQRKRAAFLMSIGTKTYETVASEAGINEKTLYDWRQCKAFTDEVDSLTLKHEMATKAGLLRLAFKAVDQKKVNLTEDRNTVLDWAEFIVKLIPEDTKNDDNKLKELTDAIMNSAKMIGK